MTSTNRSRQTAPQAIATHKAEIATLIAKLQGIVAALPADGNWPVAGSLGHIQEQLRELVGAHERVAPKLDRDEMTIWFDDERARDACKRAMSRKGRSGVGRTLVLNSRLDDKGFGIQVKPADASDDAAIDEAIDLLMETALETEGCVIPE